MLIQSLTDDTGVTGECPSQPALQVLDILLKPEPAHVEGRKLHLKILEKLCEEDYCLMSRNTWVYFMEQDREFLKRSGVKEEHFPIV